MDARRALSVRGSLPEHVPVHWNIKSIYRGHSWVGLVWMLTPTQNRANSAV
ncbi:hypothetical protein RCH22_002794 [Cryobacterium psychrotolerans]|nr:hypothetical protein [Cryobacterium psychrotolerans]